MNSHLVVVVVVDANGGARHDRTAKGFRQWARAAQSITAHPSSDTLLVGTERMVHDRRRMAIGIEDVGAGQATLGVTGHRRGRAT